MQVVWWFGIIEAANRKIWDKQSELTDMRNRRNVAGYGHLERFGLFKTTTITPAVVNNQLSCLMD